MLTIKLSKGPDAAEAAIRVALEQICQDQHAPQVLRDVNPAELKIGVHHQVYDLPVDSLLADQGLEAARLSSSRYLLAKGGKSLAAAEVTADGAGKKATFNLLNVGPFVEGFEKAVRAAEALPNGGDYSCQVLRIAPLYVLALWLKPLAGGDAILLPIHPAPAFLSADKYTQEDFLNALKPHAKTLITLA
ncbi:MAG: hypothetical protein WA173_20595 [Pseudomonas sp.]|uniref:hypothetical protein n=1 Tax=Pseudomonas sp. TaxID=306 RepID=UPI003BB7A1F4